MDIHVMLAQLQLRDEAARIGLPRVGATMMTRVYAFIHDLCFFSFFLLATVVPILFTVRLGLALFSSDKIEACYIKNQADGYVLIEQRRWQVIPQEVKLATLAEAVSVAKTICPTTGGN